MPSLRERKRYLKYRIISETELMDVKEITKLINNSIINFIGELGMSRAGVIHLQDKYNPKEKSGLLKVNNNYLDELKASLLLIKEHSFVSISTSGVLKKAEVV